MPGLQRPGKVAYWRGVASDAIPTVEKRFSQWVSPALLLRGEHDIDVCEQGACDALMRGAAPDAPITLKSYPGLYHEVIFEHYPNMRPGTNPVVDDIVAWLKAQ